MRKLLIIIAIILGIGLYSSTYADETTNNSENIVIVETTEKIPGADCKDDPKKSTKNVTIYRCEVKQGLGSVFEILKVLIRYFAVIATLTGVLFIVVNGIMISMAGVDSNLKETAKNRMMMTIWGLIVLLMSGIILRILAPWIYT